MSNALPTMEWTFTIEVKGEESQKNWAGPFTYKRLTLGSRLAASKKELYLTEELKPLLAEDARKYAEMIAWLRYGLVEFPLWWSKDLKYGLNTYDMNLITELYKKIEELEAKWEEKVYGEKKEEPKTQEEKEPKLEPKETREEK